MKHKKERRFLVCSFLIALLHGSFASAATLRVMQGSHPLDEYAVGALRVAVAELDTPYQIEVTRDQMTQTRVIEQLRANKLDVMWLAFGEPACQSV